MRIQHIALGMLLLTSGCQSSIFQNSTKDDTFRGSRDAVTADSGDSLDDQNTASIDSAADGVDGDKLQATNVEASNNAARQARVVISSYKPPAVGTVFRFKNNWASLEPKLVYRVASVDEEFQGKPAIKLDAIEGTGNGTSTYLSRSDANLLGHANEAGKTISSFTQVEQRLKFPMQPGDKWVAQWKTLEHGSRKTQSGGGIVYVVGVEKIKTAAGNFKTMKIKLPVPNKAGSLKHYIWYSPKLGMVVRERISDNRFSWVKEIEKVEYPSS